MEKRKSTLAGTIFTGALVLSASASQAQASKQTELKSSEEIRPFHIKVSEDASRKIVAEMSNLPKTKNTLSVWIPK